MLFPGVWRRRHGSRRTKFEWGPRYRVALSPANQRGTVFIILKRFCR
jgi:hypothetical protein